MTINKVLLFPSPKGNVTDAEIAQVEQILDKNGISHEIYNIGGDYDFDAVIALGGDGTMLNAARIAYRASKPIMSINFGTLGYMSGLEKGELELLSLLKTGFETEKRMLISIQVIRKDNVIATATALNEAVLQRHIDGPIAHIKLKCDGANVFDYRADGVIIATPTGSSAYAMSAGGPIVDTKLDAMCVSPICPHVLGARAMVFSGNSVLEAIDLNRSMEQGNLLLCDGRTVCGLKSGDIVRIECSKDRLEIIKLKKDAFYETLYKKMS